MLRYKTYTEMTDFGPYITKLILELPERVRAGELTDTTFHVYAECREADGSVVIRTERKSGRKALLKGYPKVLRAYPCTSDGVRCAAGDFAAIDLQEEYLNKRVAGDLLASRWLENFYRITQLHDIPGQLDGNAVNGLVYDTCAGDICPQLSGSACIRSIRCIMATLHRLLMEDPRWSFGSMARGKAGTISALPTQGTR